MNSKKIYLFFALTAAILFSSCVPSVDPEELYGQWNYIKVEDLKGYPPEVMPAEQLAEQKPSIRFSTDHKLVITWGGKTLSQGTFRISGMQIMYKEKMPDGKIREFPFLVNELDDNQIVFQTLGDDPSRVTATRAK
jgi:hypothetical protein